MEMNILIDSNNPKITDEMSTFIFNNGLHVIAKEKLIITITEVPEAKETFAVIKMKDNKSVNDIIKEIDKDNDVKVVKEKDAYGRDANYQDLIIITKSFDTELLKKALLKEYAVGDSQSSKKAKEVKKEQEKVIEPVKKEAKDNKAKEVDTKEVETVSDSKFKNKALNIFVTK